LPDAVELRYDEAPSVSMRMRPTTRPAYFARRPTQTHLARIGPLRHGTTRASVTCTTQACSCSPFASLVAAAPATARSRRVSWRGTTFPIRSGRNRPRHCGSARSPRRAAPRPLPTQQSRPQRLSGVTATRANDDDSLGARFRAKRLRNRPLCSRSLGDLGRCFHSTRDSRRSSVAAMLARRNPRPQLLQRIKDSRGHHPLVPLAPHTAPPPAHRHGSDAHTALNTDTTHTQRPRSCATARFYPALAEIRPSHRPGYDRTPQPALQLAAHS
jgi:hypothetical protein